MQKLSAKYLNLKIIEDAGLATPKTLLINADMDLDGFLRACPKNSRFIVRSIQALEDGAAQSYAGHFWSSNAIQADQIAETIELATQKNQEILKKLKCSFKPQLMLQTFIEHNVGGILFSPWSFFSDFFYIEYSSNSVQEAVEGITSNAIICSNAQQTSPIPLPTELQSLEKSLRTVTQQLQQFFDSPIDCEWAYNEADDQIIILQIRPQTTAIGAVLNPSYVISKKFKQAMGNWQYSVLSESLGRLSPLSFSLLEQLYEDSKPAFKALGYQASAVNFIQRMPDGTVLTDTLLEKEFYRTTSFGGFWRGFRTPKYQQQAQQFVSSWQEKSEFSYKNLAESFQLWMLANLISQGKGRDQILENTSYELSWRQKQSAPQISIKKYSWDDLNPLLKSIFFYELEKLKTQLHASPEDVFNEWGSYINDIKNATKDKSDLLDLQYQEARLGIYDYSLLNANADEDIQSIGAKKAASGKAFIIKTPSTFHQNIPDDCILIAPYFSNEWVHDIKRINAIIVERGGQLSHSAIVARECGVPYLIVNSSMLKAINHQDKIEIDNAGNLIQKA